MEEQKIETGRGSRYCDKCAYWYNPLSGCDCSVTEIINKVDNK